VLKNHRQNFVMTCKELNL